MSDLDAMRAENEAVWRRDHRLPDYERQVVASTSVYLPALEAEVDRLRTELREMADTLCEAANAAAASFAPENQAQADDDDALLAKWAAAAERARSQ